MNTMTQRVLELACVFAMLPTALAADTTTPIVADSLVFAESDVAVQNGKLPKAFPMVEAVSVAAADEAKATDGQLAKSDKNTSPTTPSSNLPLQLPRQADGDGTVQISGELKRWHKVTLTLNGPYAHELDNAPNPFVNYQLDVTLTHESGSPQYTIPGYFAADGDAANTSAVSGTKWRAHLSLPDCDQFLP